jgi:hypothetical protein
VIENKALVLDFLDWLAASPRDYRDVMDAWRTSCPRLTIWEDAVDHGFVSRAGGGSGGLRVSITTAGTTFLESERSPSRVKA